jgi:pimeloyl-ACP methyl ester carboxylesterase
VRLTAEPSSGLVDEAVVWRVSGGPRSGQAELRLRSTDAAGRLWESRGRHALEVDGALKIADADEPWASMRLLDREQPPGTFTPALDGWRADAEVRIDDDSAQTTVERLYARGVEQRRRSGMGWVLQVFVPQGADAPLPGVLCVGGSTGMAAVAPRAALLASHGFASAVLGYMQEPGLPKTMDRIAVEVLADALAAFVEADRGRVAIWAASVGCGLGLAALSQPHAARVAAVLATAPTDVVWQALGEDGPPPKRSSLSCEGSELPWLPMRSEVIVGQWAKNSIRRRLPGRARSTALTLHEAYARGRRDAVAVERCSIAVERIRAPMLLMAGASDAMWPAEEMARRIATHRLEAGVGSADELLVLADAGHFCGPPGVPATVDRNLDLVSGGTAAGNAAAQRLAWDRSLAFLRRALA